MFVQLLAWSVAHFVASTFPVAVNTPAFAVAIAVAIAAPAKSALPTPVTRSIGRDTVILSDSAATRLVIWRPNSSRGPVPVIVFSPGLGQRVGNYSILLDAIARQGYVVVGVEHPRVAKSDAVELYDFAETVARQLSTVFARIVTESGRPGSPFAGVDAQHIGMLGHSIGGGAGALACSRDRHCRAAMNLDGTMLGSLVHTGLQQPLFLLREREYGVHLRAPQFMERHNQATVHEDSVYANTSTMYWLSVNHLEHMSFTDDFPAAATWLERLQERAGLRVGPARAREITLRFALTFFDAYLRGTVREQALERTPFAETALKWKRVVETARVW